jgi:hypothetical protein
MPNAVQPTWSPDQSEIITSPATERMMINAGPGTGKTAILCARIAFLINECDVTPENIWVISFTRTAVAELRHRVSGYLDDPRNALAIKIATIDAYAWSINCGFRSDATLTGSFDSNIQNVVQLVQENQGVFEYLSSLEHLFVDEAQDVVDLRCELLLEIISAISITAGITIFCDEAQGIYGFAQNNVSARVIGNLPVALRNSVTSLTEKTLSTIYRTEDVVLRELNTSCRDVLQGNLSSKEKLSAIHDLVSRHNHGQSPQISGANVGSYSDSTFLLFRRRGEALSAIRSFAGIPIRVRLNDYPPVVKSWVGELLWDWTESRISRNIFFQRWATRVQATSEADCEAEWSNLVSVCGISNSEVNVHLLNSRLASPSPPIEFCDEYMGVTGPLISTIHAAKGREAKTVHLFLPPKESQSFARTARSKGSDDPVLEEARVLFVGATRAREELFVSRMRPSGVENLKQATRCYQELGEKLTEVNFELGRNADILADGLVGRDLFGSQPLAISAQAQVRSLRLKTTTVNARLQSGAFAIYKSDASHQPMAWLSNFFDKALRKLLWEKHLRSHGNHLTGITILGTRTLAISELNRQTVRLHHPWDRSGFMLAPVVVGFPSINVSTKIRFL